MSAFGYAIRTIDKKNGRRWLWGKFWWLEGRLPGPLPERVDGYVTCVWKYRYQAEDALRAWKARFNTGWHRRTYGWTTVVRVRVDVTIVADPTRTMEELTQELQR